MSLRPYRDIKKKKTKEIKVGNVKIGQITRICSINDKHFNN